MEHPNIVLGIYVVILITFIFVMIVMAVSASNFQTLIDDNTSSISSGTLSTMFAFNVFGIFACIFVITGVIYEYFASKNQDKAISELDIKLEKSKGSFNNAYNMEIPDEIKLKVDKVPKLLSYNPEPENLRSKHVNIDESKHLENDEILDDISEVTMSDSDFEKNLDN